MSPESHRPLPLNRDRARMVMERHGIDGLVALRPHNVYYLSNTWPVFTDFGGEFPALATFPSDPSQPGFFVGTSGSAWDLLKGDREVPEYITFSGVENWQDYIDATPEQMRKEPVPYGTTLQHRFAVNPDNDLSPREARWNATQQGFQPNNAASIEWALVRALQQSGLAGGRIAVDDMRIAHLLSRIGYEAVTCVPGDNIFREIRLVKQAHEIDLIRRAQMASREAALAAARSLAPGMTYQEARANFTATAATHGAEIGFLLIGITQGMLPDEVVRAGRSYMIDCGAKYQHYMGDFARTVSIGDPTATLLRRHQAQQIGRAAALEHIRPGVMFSEVNAIGRAAMIKAGMPSEVIAACHLHSVGLQHDDQPTRDDVPYPIPQDFALQPGMCVTLDLPYIELGWGAGHNEDLLLITDSGFEFLNAPDDPMIVAG
ncbi:MAG: M24 family metallopeptidase [Azospirillaceae bacterium]|nr:M24 family metallopeptidase [Azospirillaceae bacterium]